MAHAIVWLPAAANDLEGISDYIGARSRAYADAMIERILAAVDDLPQFPRMGPAVRDVPVWKGVELRERLAPPYRVIYRIKDDRIVILAVVHGARLLRRALRGRRLD